MFYVYVRYFARLVLCILRTNTAIIFVTITLRPRNTLVFRLRYLFVKNKKRINCSIIVSCRNESIAVALYCWRFVIIDGVSIHLYMKVSKLCAGISVFSHGIFVVDMYFSGSFINIVKVTIS